MATSNTGDGRPATTRRVILALWTVAAMQACASHAVAPSAPPPGPLTLFPIMGPARLTPAQLAQWFTGRQPPPGGTWAASVPLDSMVSWFVEEGAAEGVTGDVAFVQSVIETGWFRFNGSVPASKNNFAGIGAVDSDPGTAATFPDARTGIRAQIQHLRAYADATALTCSVPPLHNACVDPRFALVVPKGRSPTWGELGRGNWATSSTYGSDIVTRYREALVYHSLTP